MWEEPGRVREGSRLPLVSTRLLSVSSRFLLGSVRPLLPRGGGLGRESERERQREARRAAASSAHAFTSVAAFRAVLCLVFSLPSLESCIRVVAFSIVSGKRPRTLRILGLLLHLVQANKVFLSFLLFFF